MPVVELPAQYVDSDGAAEIVGGPTALATRATGSYVRLNWNDNSRLASVGGYNETQPGFGLVDLPDGAVVTDMRFIAEGYIDDDGDAPNVDEDEFTAVQPGYTNTPIHHAPFIAISYYGDDWIDGTNISNFAVSPIPQPAYGEEQVNSFFFDADYVIAGIGETYNGTQGIHADIILNHWPIEDPSSNASLYITYLAIKVTYDEAEVTPPPSAAVGRGIRRYPHPRTQRAYPAHP
jgi:hypothetical protein